ncbi:hypothetical protein [Lysobacter sp. 22409]|uniref:hypothetical protein n=1 Tax=Lysobacter sp. 22409 TaxID=3453917 RepID=UPI003F872ED2
MYLKKAAPKTKKLLQKLPSLVDDVAVIYKQGVTTPIGPDAPTTFAGAPYALKQLNNINYYTCGSSISVGNYREAGTLGALLSNGQRFYGLSNGHVVSGCNHAALRTPIVAPGIVDVCAQNIAPFTIGYYAGGLPLIPGSPDTVPWKDNCDVAFFEVANMGAMSSSQQNFYDTPASVLPIADGMSVSKVGRTTGHTVGTVVGVMAGSLSMPYHAAVYDFKGPVHLAPVYLIEGLATRFSEGGDSGSLVTHMDSHGARHAVGIVFGGMQSSSAKGGGYSLVLPLQPILARLGMTLVSGHNI